MIKKILLGLAAVLVLFLGYANTRESKFRYERSGLINASAEKIFPYISQFKTCSLWSPYEKKDLNMKRKVIGTDGQIGSIMEFDGNSDVGAGSLEFLRVEPNQSVVLRLLMTKPMKADHMIEYRLTPEGNGTRFTWAMYGDGGYMGKVIGLLIDCEKMVAGDMEIGIQNLKALVESQK